MNIWTLEHEKQEHIMFYTIEKWDIAYTLSFDGSKKADSWNKPQIYSDYHPESHPYVDYQLSKLQFDHRTLWPG